MLRLRHIGLLQVFRFLQACEIIIAVKLGGCAFLIAVKVAAFVICGDAPAELSYGELDSSLVISHNIYSGTHQDFLVFRICCGTIYKDSVG